MVKGDQAGWTKPKHPLNGILVRYLPVPFHLSNVFSMPHDILFVAEESSAV